MGAVRREAALGIERAAQTFHEPVHCLGDQVDFGG
jgi:hypothetical protein